MKTRVLSTFVVAAGLLGGGSAAHADNAYLADCHFRDKSVKLAIWADPANTRASISVNNGPNVEAWREKATDGPGWLIHESNSPTVWFAGGAHRASSVLLNGKWYPLSCGEFALYNDATSSAPSYAATGGDNVPIVLGADDAVHVMVTLGGMTVDMVLDTGAALSSIPAAIADQLIAAGQARELDPMQMGMADGSAHPMRTISINTLTIGSHTRTNVKVVVSDNGMSLLGLPVLNAIGKFSIDAVGGQLTFG
jgi:predicted aspartyl protease